MGRGKDILIRASEIASHDAQDALKRAGENCRKAAKALTNSGLPNVAAIVDRYLVAAGNAEHGLELILAQLAAWPD